MTPEQLFSLAVLALIMTNIVAPIFVWLTSAEQRRRDLEDRREVAREAKRFALEAKESAEVVHSAVIKVGEKAEMSYKEANNANMKIQAVQDVLTTALNLPTRPITVTTGAEPEGEQQPKAASES